MPPVPDQGCTNLILGDDDVPRRCGKPVLEALRAEGLPKVCYWCLMAAALDYDRSGGSARYPAEG